MEYAIHSPAPCRRHGALYTHQPDITVKSNEKIGLCVKILRADRFFSLPVCKGAFLQGQGENVLYNGFKRPLHRKRGFQRNNSQ